MNFHPLLNCSSRSLSFESLSDSAWKYLKLSHTFESTFAISRNEFYTYIVSGVQYNIVPLNVSLKNILPIFSCFSTTSADHQREHILLPVICVAVMCNIQPGTQYSGVHPTTSSEISHKETLLSVLHLIHLIIK